MRVSARIRLALYTWHQRRAEHHMTVAEDTITTLQHKHGVHMHMTQTGKVYRRIGPAIRCKSAWCRAASEVTRELVDHPDVARLHDDGAPC